MEPINLMKEKGYTLEKSQKTNNVIKARLVGLPEQELEVLNCMSLFPEKVSIEEIELLPRNILLKSDGMLSFYLHFVCHKYTL